jgi:hypothetical protein
MKKNIPNSIPKFDVEDALYEFGSEFPRHPNTLFAENERLFLANVVNKKIDEIEEVSLVEALEWYVLLTPIAGGAYGSIELLCSMAAKALSKNEVVQSGPREWN